MKIEHGIPMPAPKGVGWGGARPNSAPGKPAQRDFAEARARLEAARADLRELAYKIESKQVLERAAVRQTAATAFAHVAQVMRSIGDDLERQGVDPLVAQAVSESIDDTLAELSATLERHAQ